MVLSDSPVALGFLLLRRYCGAGLADFKQSHLVTDCAATAFAVAATAHAVPADCLTRHRHIRHTTIRFPKNTATQPFPCDEIFRRSRADNPDRKPGDPQPHRAPYRATSSAARRPAAPSGAHTPGANPPPHADDHPYVTAFAAYPLSRILHYRPSPCRNPHVACSPVPHTDSLSRHVQSDGFEGPASVLSLGW